MPTCQFQQPLVQVAREVLFVADVTMLCTVYFAGQWLVGFVQELLPLDKEYS